MYYIVGVFVILTCLVFYLVLCNVFLKCKKKKEISKIIPKKKHSDTNQLQTWFGSWDVIGVGKELEKNICYSAMLNLKGTPLGCQDSQKNILDLKGSINIQWSIKNIYKIRYILSPQKHDRM